MLYYFCMQIGSNQRVFVTGLLLSVGSAFPAAAQWTSPNWQIQRVGLIDAEHTNSSGLLSSTPFGISASGRVAGQSNRYVGANPAGSSAWVWSPVDGTVRLGYTDAAHTASDGSRGSAVLALTPSGQVVGTSNRYAGTNVTGKSAWVDRPGQPFTRIGLFGGAYVATNGRENTVVRAFNDADQVAGYSERFIGNSGNGDTWFWSPPTGLLTFGFTDSTHRLANGISSADVTAMSSSGHVIGTASRFVNSFPSGFNAWAWAQSFPLTQIGLSDAEHTRQGGRQESTPTAVNANGRVIGSSTRYNGGTNAIGASSWTWANGSGTVRLGYTDAPFTGSGNVQSSTAVAINTSGAVIGKSTMYSAVANLRTGAWIWTQSSGLTDLGYADALHTSASGGRLSDVVAINDAGRVCGSSAQLGTPSGGGSTAWTWTQSFGLEQIGLTDAQHISPQGYSVNVPKTLTAAGMITGTAARYVNFNYANDSLWAWTREHGTVQIGLFDAVHTTSSGTQAHGITASNTGVIVAGYSLRPPSSSDEGQTGWVYDGSSNVVTPLEIGIGPNNEIYVVPKLVTDDGLVFGTYRNFASPQTEFRAFVWSIDRGISDLGELAQDLVPGGWAYLTGVNARSSTNSIVGTGSLAGNTQAQGAFVLTRCPADLNNDLSIDLADFFEFLGCFDASLPCADVVADGEIDLADFFFYLTAFDQGC